MNFGNKSFIPPGTRDAKQILEIRVEREGNNRSNKEFKLGGLGGMSLGMLNLGKLGEVSFGILELGEVNELNYAKY